MPRDSCVCHRRWWLLLHVGRQLCHLAGHYKNLHDMQFFIVSILGTAKTEHCGQEWGSKWALFRHFPSPMGLSALAARHGALIMALR